MTRCGALAALVTTALAGDAAAVAVTGVRHDPPAIESSAGETVSVRFHLDTPARVALRVFDGRDLEVRSIDAGKLPAGDHAIRWDGRDVKGRPVPPEAYLYTLEAVAESGDPVVWDAPEAANEGTQVLAISWDREVGTIAYSLAQPSRVRIRVGLGSDGPLLRTVVDWVARSPGTHAEAWDGRDASGALDLSKHPGLEIVAQAFPLAGNVIVVGPPAPEVRRIEDLPSEGRRRVRPSRSPRAMFEYASETLDERRDYPIRLTLPASLPRSADDLPIVRGPVAVQLDVSEEERGRALGERAEAVFFLDGRMVFETETAFLPMTWTWEPRGASPGRHFLTANLRGYDGHFGIGTLEFLVAAGNESDEEGEGARSTNAEGTR